MITSRINICNSSKLRSFSLCTAPVEVLIEDLGPHKDLFCQMVFIWSSFGPLFFSLFSLPGLQGVTKIYISGPMGLLRGRLGGEVGRRGRGWLGVDVKVWLVGEVEVGWEER